MRVHTVIPWRGGDEARAAALRWVWRSLFESGAPPAYLAEAGGAWSKPQAIRQHALLPELDHAPQADVLVLHDADVWVEPDALQAAISAVEAGYPWAVPHRRVHRLTEESTLRVLTGTPASQTMSCVKRPYRGTAAGGIVVIPRATLLEVQPDERFTGWGGEDAAWRDALRCLVGMEWRETSAPLFHLAHEPAERTGHHHGSDANRALVARYAAARHDPDAMRALLAETQVAA